MTRPSDWSPLGLSHDPVPGDPAVVGSYATRFSSIASEIGTASTQLGNILADDASVSEYVDAIRGLAEEVADRIGRVQTRYTGAAEAVRVYGLALANAQEAADAALTAARGGASSAHYASSLIMRYEYELAQPDITPEDKLHYERLLRNAESDLADAQAASSNAQAALQSAIDARNNAANTCIEALSEVQAAGDLNDSGWDDFAQWWESNQELIDTIVMVVGIIAAVVTVVLLLIPGVNLVVLTVIAIAVAAITIANALIGMAVGSKPVAQGILEIALALIPFRLGAIANAAAGTVVKQGTRTVMASWTSRGATHFTVDNAAALVQHTINKTQTTVLQRFFSESAQELAAIQGIRELTISGAPQVFNQVVAAQTWKFYLSSPLAEVVWLGIDQLQIPDHVGELLTWELPPAERW